LRDSQFSDNKSEASAATIVVANQSDGGDALATAAACVRLRALFAVGTVIIGRQFSQLRATRPDRTRAWKQNIVSASTTDHNNDERRLCRLQLYLSFPAAAAAAMTSRQLTHITSPLRLTALHAGRTAIIQHIFLTYKL